MVYKTFWTKEKRDGVEMGYLISEERMGDLQAVEEESSIHGRKIIAGNSKTTGHKWYPLAGSCLSTMLNSNQSEANILRAPSWSRFLHLNLWDRKLGESKIFWESCFSINSWRSMPWKGSLRVAKLWFPSCSFYQQSWKCTPGTVYLSIHSPGFPSDDRLCFFSHNLARKIYLLNVGSSLLLFPPFYC